MQSRRCPPVASVLFCLVLAGWLVACGSAVAVEAPSLPAPPASTQPVPPPKSLDEVRAIENKVKQVAARVIPCTVAVRVGTSQGSGVLVSKEGHVLTAGHVIGKPGQKATFVFPDGTSREGTTLGVQQDSDAGLAKISDAAGLPFVEMAALGSLRPGMWCLALGHPLGLQRDRPPVIRLGRVLALRDNTVQTDCTLVAGDSGGPLVDLDGRVIGINSRINAGLVSMNFHVSIDAFHRDWDRLLRGETWNTRIESKEECAGQRPFPPGCRGSQPLRSSRAPTARKRPWAPSSAPMGGF